MKLPIKTTILMLCVVICSTGCRNRCNSPCGGGFFAANPLIAPPATYSMNIPSVAQNPYYTPGANGNSVLNTAGQAPIGNGVQTGWRRADDGAANGANSNVNPGRSVLNQNTTFVEVSPTSNSTGGVASGLPGTGTSYTAATDYRTTQVNENSDPTRLAVTDASRVIAPARNYPTGSPTFVAQAQVLPGGYNGQTYAQNNNAQRPVAFQGQAQFVQQPSSFQGQAMLSNPYSNGAAYSNVSTAAQPGWVNRERSSSFQR